MSKTIDNSQKHQTEAIEDNENKIKEMIDEKINYITNYFKPLGDTIQITSNTSNMGLPNTNQYKKSDKINNLDKEYNKESYQTDTRDTRQTSFNLCTKKINELCNKNKSDHQSTETKEIPNMTSPKLLFQPKQCRMLPMKKGLERVIMSQQTNKASTKSSTREIEKLEDIHEVSTKYAHNDESFDDYDYDIHRCNQAQYEDYENDSKSNDKNLINNDMQRETEPITQAYVNAKNLNRIDKDLKKHIRENETIESIDEKDIKDKPTYDCDFDMSHHRKAIDELENGSVRKSKTLYQDYKSLLNDSEKILAIMQHIIKTKNKVLKSKNKVTKTKTISEATDDSGIENKHRESESIDDITNPLDVPETTVEVKEMTLFKLSTTQLDSLQSTTTPLNIPRFKELRDKYEANMNQIWIFQHQLKNMVGNPINKEIEEALEDLKRKEETLELELKQLANKTSNIHQKLTMPTKYETMY